MWHVMMILAMALLGSLSATLDKTSLLANENADAVNMAQDMAHYREAIIAYFAQNSTAYPSVTFASTTRETQPCSRRSSATPGASFRDPAA